jgi:hypothetical protein
LSVRWTRWEEAEPLEDLDPDPAAEALGVVPDDLAQALVQVLARRPLPELQDETLVVEPRRSEGDVVQWDTYGLGQEGVGVADRVTHADHVRERGSRVHAPRHHRHRVRVVQQEGVRRELVQVVADPHHQRDRPQAPHDAADAQGVGDRLTHAEAPRDLEVGHGGPVPAHLDLVDREVHTLERGTALHLGLDLVPGVGPADDRLRCATRVGKTFLVDIV